MKAELIDYMGSDLTVVNAARVSFDKASSWDMDEEMNFTLPKGDKGLIKFLANHNHWTPFAHPQITLRETVPIFVARQRFKHMVGFTYNEISRRYVDDEPTFFEPEVWRSRPEGSVKQGSGVEPIETMIVTSNGGKTTPHKRASGINKMALDCYRDMIDQGVAPEQARMVLPQSMFTSYHVTGSLAAFARAYKQRIDAHSQAEIQELAKQWNTIIQPLYPESWAALTGETK